MRQFRPSGVRSALRVAFLSLLAPLAGCSPASFLNSFIPSDDYRVERDLSYGPKPRQRLDVYVPNDLKAPAPVIVFFYGGRWESGSKDSYVFAAQAFASAGAVVVIPDYRLYPEVIFPTFLEDAAAAVAWVQHEIARFGGDPARLALAGHSAGAHVAALVALDRSYLEAAGGAPEQIDALIGIAGPYDFLPIRDPTIKQIFAVDDLQQTQPITFVRPQAPRTLLLHGRDDRTVGPHNSEHLAAALEQAGSEVTLHLYDRIGHIEIVAALAKPLRWLAPTRADALRFLGLGGTPAPERPAG